MNRLYIYSFIHYDIKHEGFIIDNIMIKKENSIKIKRIAQITLCLIFDFEY